jgi:hypothetical protein
MRKTEMALVRNLRLRMGGLAADNTMRELLVGAVLALEASGWSKPAIFRVLRAVTTHRFGDTVGETVASGVRTSAN